MAFGLWAGAVLLTLMGPAVFVGLRWRVRVEAQAQDGRFDLQLELWWAGRHWCGRWPLPDWPSEGHLSPAAPAPEPGDHPETIWSEVGQARKGLAFYARLIDQLYQRAVIEEAWADAALGAGDAFVTALMTGALYAAAGVWMGRIGPRLAGEPHFRIEPQFGEPTVRGSAGSIFRLSGGDIMGALWQAARQSLGGQQNG
jgi:hypothetical protein